MKQRLLTALLASAIAIICITGCGTTTAETTAETTAQTTEAATEAQSTEAETEVQTTEAETETQTTEAADNKISEEISEYVGTYTSDYDGSELTFNEDGTMELSLYRLTDQTGTVEKIEDGVIYVTMEDASGNDMKATFTPSTNVFEITDSTWEYLTNGDTYEFTK